MTTVDNHTEGAQTDRAHAAGIAQRGTSVAVGAAALAWERIAAPRTGPGWRDVAVGALFGLEDAAAGLLAAARSRTAERATAFSSTVRRRAAELAERGAAE